MVTVTDNMITKLSNLTTEQFSIFTALLDEFSSENSSSSSKDVSKRIGVAKDIEFPAEFDDIDYDTTELFGIK